MHSETAMSNDLEAGTNSRDKINNNQSDRVGTVVEKKARRKVWFGVAIAISIAVIVGVVLVVFNNNDKGATNTLVSNETNGKAPPANIDEDTKEVTVNTKSPSESDIGAPTNSNEDTDMGDTRPSSESIFKPLDNDDEGQIMFKARKISTSLPRFDSAILDGYDHCDELYQDITQAYGDLANINIQYFMKNPWPIMALAESTYDGPYDDTSSSTRGAEEDSYGTNNQSDDVDEADLIKSDGKFVYVVYGGEILTLNPKDGSVVSRLRLIYDEMPSGKRRASLYWGASEQINGLLLYGSTTLVATITSGYFYGFGLGPSESSTKVVTMNISSETGELTEVDSTTVKGRYMAGRMIDTVAHLVTSSSVYHWEFIEEIARYNPKYSEMSDTDYVDAAFARARLIIPKYASRLMSQLLPEEYDPAVECRRVARLSRMQPADEEAASNYNNEGLLNGFVRIISFDMGGNLGASEHNLTAAFTPTTYADVYASRDMLFLGGQGYSQSENGGWEEYTYITAFELSGSTATPVATGTVPGYTLNQFSMDYYDDHLRIATSTREDGFWDDEAGVYTVLSESTNQIMVTKIENDEIVIVGEVKDLGLDERIYAARFMEDRGFLVTFRQIDPFYTLDLSDPTNPQMKGELKIPGFSNYLHPVDDTYILAVGQDADENGGTLGLQISLFDVSDFSNPRQVGKYVVPGWSSSESQYNHYAFRYLPQSKKLVLPVSRYGQRTIDGTDDEAFDGFHVYSITPEVDRPIGIDYVVSHYDKEVVMNHYCYGQASLPSRSMVFEGNLMTLKGHSVMGHVLNTGDKLYYGNMDETKKTNSTDSLPCYGWFH